MYVIDSIKGIEYTHTGACGDTSKVVTPSDAVDSGMSAVEKEALVPKRKWSFGLVSLSAL